MNKAICLMDLVFISFPIAKGVGRQILTLVSYFEQFYPLSSGLYQSFWVFKHLGVLMQIELLDTTLLGRSIWGNKQGFVEATIEEANTRTDFPEAWIWNEIVAR